MTDHCNHLHRDVTQEECAMCWVGVRGDADCYAYGASDDRTTLIIHLCAQGWDKCRGKHISRRKADKNQA